MAAAVECAERGCKTVLVEREASTGGVLNQCIHNGFGLHVFKEELTGPEYAHLFQKQMADRGIDVHPDRFVLKVDPQKKEVITIGASGATCYKPNALIMTTGARERSFANLRIPGTRPSGIFTAGVAQRFVNLQNRLPGKKAFILGSGDIGLIMARRLTLEGMEVLGVAELMPFPGGLARNISQCLDDFDIPLYLSTSVVEVHGKERLNAITLARFDPGTGKVLPGTRKTIEVDTLILSVGLLPQNELIEDFCEVDAINRGVRVDSMMRTSNPWIFAAGNNVTVYDLVDFVTLDAKFAGQMAATIIKGGRLAQSAIPLKRGKNVGAMTPGKVCAGGNPFTIFLRSRKVMEKGRIELGPGLLSRVHMGIRPSEMLEVKVTQGHLEKIQQMGWKELTISLEEVEA